MDNNKDNSKTYSDLAVIFKMMPDDMIKKIDSKFIEYVQNNADVNYKSNIKPYIPLREQIISKETERMLGLIYEKYLLTEEEKKKLLSEEQENLRQKCSIKNVDDIFKNGENKKRIDSTRKENDEEKNKLEPVKKVSLHKKIVNWIKKYLNLIKT